MNMRNHHKKTAVLCCLFLVCGLPLMSQDWNLVWSDEFESSTINEANWTFETGRGVGGNWGTGQVDYATSDPKNVRIEDGILKLTLRNDGAPDKDANRPYTSARLISQGKQEFTYGRIEARLKGISGQGLGFAFWLLGVDTKTLGWPKCGELDIAEITGRTPGFNIGTAHYRESWGHASSQGKLTLPDNGSFENDFHVFGIEWTKAYIKWYIDDQVYHTMDITGDINGWKPFSRPFFMILSIGVGGTYSGSPDQTTVFPETAEIDWVRVYQQENTPPEITFSDFQLFENKPSGSLDVGLNTTDQESNVDYVEFFINNSLKKKFTEPPYVYVWDNPADGCYKLTTRAVDRLGESSETAFSYVKIGDGCGQTPYLGTPFSIPGQIDAVYFDKGKNGFAYYDKDNKNQGAAFRPAEEVDIWPCTDETGEYMVGSVGSPEFLTYSIVVGKEAAYDLIFRTTGVEDGEVQITLPNSEISQTVKLAATGGEHKWTSTRIEKLNLKAGQDLMKLSVVKGNHNLNWYKWIDSLSGLDSPVSATQAMIYPNPLSGKGYVETVSGEIIRRVDIYSMCGQLVQQFYPAGEVSVYELDVTGMTAGGYLTRVVLDKDEQTLMMWIK